MKSSGMLQRLELENVRGFDQHTVPLKELAVLVGANNAGKTTLVEALRLLALVVNRLRLGTAAFSEPPDWLDDTRAFRGVQPARRERGQRGSELDAHTGSTFFLYRTPPAVIAGHFSDGSSVMVFVGPDGEIHGVARDSAGRPVDSVAGAKHLGLSALAIQPQVAPLLRTERYLTDETVRRGEGTYLASQHFRNQLLRSSESEYNNFKAMAERTWPGLQLRGLEGYSPLHPGRPIEFHIRDYDFVGEVSLMGHGLQMWLQTVWFLARTEAAATVVVDEPDVYMHPDLQRRILELVLNRFQQLLIATHSIEIVSDVDPRSILSVDRRQPSSTFVTDLPGVQDVINSLGGVHNIQVTRLFTSRSFLFIEGDDVKLLRILQNTVAPTAEPIDLVPHGELGGRGGWSTGLPLRLPDKNVQGEKIIRYALLDRDYFPDEEVDERYLEARNWRVSLRVWSRKELENYLLIPAAVSRLIEDKARRGVTPPEAGDVAEEIDRIVETMKDVPITDGFAATFLSRDKRAGLPKANQRARAHVETRWASQEGRWSIAPGKDVISALSRWSQAAYGVSFGPEQLARTLDVCEIDSEISEVLEVVPTGKRLKMPTP
jgi:hypothetical protein